MDFVVDKSFVNTEKLVGIVFYSKSVDKDIALLGIVIGVDYEEKYILFATIKQIQRIEFSDIRSLKKTDKVKVD